MSADEDPFDKDAMRARCIVSPSPIRGAIDRRESVILGFQGLFWPGPGDSMLADWGFTANLAHAGESGGSAVTIDATIRADNARTMDDPRGQRADNGRSARTTRGRWTIRADNARTMDDPRGQRADNASGPGLCARMGFQACARPAGNPPSDSTPANRIRKRYGPLFR